MEGQEKKSVLTLVVPVPMNDVIRHGAELVFPRDDKRVLPYFACA